MMIFGPSHSLIWPQNQCYGSGTELHTKRNSNMRRKEERTGSIWQKQTSRTSLGVLLLQAVSSTWVQQASNLNGKNRR